MKFEFSRSFLMGLAVAGLLTSCGGSSSWVDSPDNWAQAPMPGVSPAPAAPQNAPQTPEAPTVAEAPPVQVPAEVAANQAPAEPMVEAPPEPKKRSWWKKKENKEEVAPVPEVVSNEPVAAPEAPVAPQPTAVEGPPVEAQANGKRSLWDVMTGKNKTQKQEVAVAESNPEVAPGENAEAPRPEAAPAAASSPDYPTAERVKFMNGWVYSPYDSRKINVRGMSSGSLVADPRYALDQKKYFRVP